MSNPVIAVESYDENGRSEYIARTRLYPSLSWIAETPVSAAKGLMSLIEEVEVDLIKERLEESQKRIDNALKYLQNCRIMRVEPDKYKLEDILRGLAAPRNVE